MPFPLPSLPGCPLADWLMAGLPCWIPLDKLLGRKLGRIIFTEHLFLCSDKGQRLSAEPVCSGTWRSQPIPCHRSARSPSLSRCAQSTGTSWALAQGWARCSLPADTPSCSPSTRAGSEPHHTSHPCTGPLLQPPLFVRHSLIAPQYPAEPSQSRADEGAPDIPRAEPFETRKENLCLPDSRLEHVCLQTSMTPRLSYLKDVPLAPKHC